MSEAAICMLIILSPMIITTIYLDIVMIYIVIKTIVGSDKE